MTNFFSVRPIFTDLMISLFSDAAHQARSLPLTKKARLELAADQQRESVSRVSLFMVKRNNVGIYWKIEGRAGSQGQGFNKNAIGEPILEGMYRKSDVSNGFERKQQINL